MAVNVFLSLPHPHDEALNYGLSLLRDATDPAEDRFFCHGDMNETPLQRHARNLLKGVESRRDKVLHVMKWVKEITAVAPNVHIYSRFFLADFQTPASLARIDSFLELAWLYFSRHDPRIVFVDYANALNGAKAHCVEMVKQRVLKNGGLDAEAKRLADEYREEWSFNTEVLLDRAKSTFGTKRVSVVTFCESRKVQVFFEDLRDEVFHDRLEAAPALLSNLKRGSPAIAALERVMARQGIANWQASP